MIRPYVRRPPVHPVGILGADGSILGDEGGRVYVGFERAHDLLLAGEADAITWNGDPIRLRIGTTEAIVLRSDVPPDDELLEALEVWRDWLAAAGASIGSFGSAAWSLLRASLSEPLRTSWGAVPPLRGVIGGRQVMRVRPGRYAGELVHYDLRSSYPAVLAQLRYGGAWAWLEQLDLAQALGLAAVGTPVYVSAIVTFPEGLSLGPLPRRPRGRTDSWRSFLQPAPYPTRKVAGFWTAAEVGAAIGAGARVRYRGAWVHAAADRPFAAWWDRIESGRELAGFASQLAKITGNALWGQLAISTGDRQVLSFAGGRRRVRSEPLRGAGRPRIFDLAEYVTGSVRARLYAELLSTTDTLSAHTDGGWCRAGNAPGGPGWRTKDHARVLYLINPQALAYVRPSGELVYRVAGVPASKVRQTFGELWRAEVGSELPTLSDSGVVAG